MDGLRVRNVRIELVKGDITGLDVDAIVNAANEGLILGGGVAGAIRARGGPMIQQECDRIGGTPVGTAVITTGGELAAKYVIHAVGPRAGEGDEERKLAGAVRSSLRIADEKGIKTIAFPAISSGIFGYPVKDCARVMIGTILDYIKNGCGLERIVLCLYDSGTLVVFEEELQRQSKAGESK